MTRPGPNEHVIILGATSAMARAVADQLAEKGTRLLLAGRDVAELQRLADDVRLRHGGVCEAAPFDAGDFASHVDFYASCVKQLDDRVDGVVWCVGDMPEQADAAADFAVAKRTIETNYTAAVSVLGIVANDFEARKAGWIAALGSVAGDRGRQSNYVYGSAKSALAAYLQGLRNRLHHAGVHVLTVKPGFVDTAMTWGLVTDSPLTVSPERAAATIVRALRRRKNIVYVPWRWRIIMAIIRAIPEWLFKRLRM